MPPPSLLHKVSLEVEPFLFYKLSILLNSPKREINLHEYFAVPQNFLLMITKGLSHEIMISLSFVDIFDGKLMFPFLNKLNISNT